MLCVIQEAGNVGLEQRCAGAKIEVLRTLTNLQIDNTDLAGSEATIESKLQSDSSIDGILSLGGDMSGQAVKAVDAVGSDVTVGTFDVNADVVSNVTDGKLAFAVDQQPYVQGYMGSTGSTSRRSTATTSAAASRSTPARPSSPRTTPMRS